jgi:hypothetical protein
MPSLWEGGNANAVVSPGRQRASVGVSDFTGGNMIATLRKTRLTENQLLFEFPCFFLPCFKSTHLSLRAWKSKPQLPDLCNRHLYSWQEKVAGNVSKDQCSLMSWRIFTRQQFTADNRVGLETCNCYYLFYYNRLAGAHHRPQASPGLMPGKMEDGKAGRGRRSG